MRFRTYYRIYRIKKFILSNKHLVDLLSVLFGLAALIISIVAIGVSTTANKIAFNQLTIQEDEIAKMMNEAKPNFVFYRNGRNEVQNIGNRITDVSIKFRKVMLLTKRTNSKTFQMYFEYDDKIWGVSHVAIIDSDIKVYSSPSNDDDMNNEMVMSVPEKFYTNTQSVWFHETLNAYRYPNYPSLYYETSKETIRGNVFLLMDVYYTDKYSEKRYGAYNIGDDVHETETIFPDHTIYIAGDYYKLLKETRNDEGDKETQEWVLSKNEDDFIEKLLALDLPWEEVDD